jgi:excisionase family DNA binding protein
MESITNRERLAMTVAEFAESVGISLGLARLEIARGRLRPARIGRRLAITRAEAERYLREAMGEAR